MSSRNIRGTILYTSTKPERNGEERGREYFTISQQVDGIDVMMAHCEIDDAPPVIRDVSMALRHDDSSPVDCSVRLTVGGQFEGSGWMRFADNYAECETYNRKDGRITQKIDTPNKIDWLQSHPIVGDALLMKLYDLSQGPGEQVISNLFLTSPDHRGATGPQFFVLDAMTLVYLGEEDIDIAAGKFRARHFQVTGTEGNLPEEHPPYDLWCTADDDYLFLKGSVKGYMQTHYELTELNIN